MKKKLALLMAAIMTVAMVPMTAFAAAKTDIVAVDQIKVAVDGVFTSRVELQKDEDAMEATEHFEVKLTLENAKFSKADEDDDDYEMEATSYLAKCIGVKSIDVINDHTAKIKLDRDNFNGFNNQDPVMIPIKAKAEAVGDVVATFSTNETIFADAKEVIATVVDDEVIIESAGVVTFVEDGASNKKLKDITINGAALEALTGKDIVLKLKGDYEYDETHRPIVTLLNDADAEAKVESKFDTDKDELTISFPKAPTDKKLTMITISGIYLNTTKKTDVGDVAKITVTSKDFDSVTLEVAKMVAEAVTYTVEDDDLPTIWAGKDYGADKNLDDVNTLKLSVEENTGDILNTSRKATFTFPEGIEVVGVKLKGTPGIVTGVSKTDITDDGVKVLDIDENVVTIRNYSKGVESNKTDMDIEFILNAAPTFEGDVKVTLGGEFDDVEFTVATVKAPYTVEAKTSEVLIDYRYVPVNEIVITEAEEGILAEDAVIKLAVEKMDFEDAGSYEVTEGDIEVDVDIVDDDDATVQLVITVDDDSTEASTIVISGLELYLDRTLPVGGYALTNECAKNILWENSRSTKTKDNVLGYDENGLFKTKAVTVNDSYVEVVTQARDQDDYTTSRKIVITIGATTMAVGTETVTLDAPAYINAENYTELPLRAVSEAFGATVAWDDASRTVTIMMGQRIVSMTIGSKTMYINGTPVAMNTAPEITADRTFVPVRDLANALGISKIDWNEAAATVTLN